MRSTGRAGLLELRGRYVHPDDLADIEAAIAGCNAARGITVHAAFAHTVPGAIPVQTTPQPPTDEDIVGRLREKGIAPPSFVDVDIVGPLLESTK